MYLHQVLHLYQCINCPVLLDLEQIVMNVL